MMVELGVETAIVFCLVFLAWWVVFRLAEYCSAENPNFSRPKPCCKVCGHCESSASTTKRDASDARRQSPSHKTPPVHKSKRPRRTSEPAAVQRARAKLLEPEDGVQAPPGRRRASGSEPNLSLSLDAEERRGVGRVATTLARSISATTSSPASLVALLRKSVGTPAGRRREAAPPFKISPGTRFLLSHIKRRESS